MKITLVCLCSALLILANTARAEDAYYTIQLASLKSTNGAVASAEARRRGLTPQYWHVVIDGPERAFMDDARPTPWMTRLSPNAVICIQAPAGATVTGRLYVSKPEAEGVDTYEFKAAPGDTKPEAKEAFFRAKETFYQRLVDARVPGGAWFRYQVQEAARMRTGRTNKSSPFDRQPFGTRPQPELEDAYNLYSGGRALSENLQLDRTLPQSGTNQETVEITNLTGITVKEMDWKELIKDAKPDLDPLASFIPADQHAIFFPSFQAMVQAMDEADANGTPVLELMEPRSEDAGSRAFYEKQMCLGLNDVSRMLGPKMVSSVAFTGSDPFVRVGTDIAILFEARNADTLKAFLVARQQAVQTAVAGVKKVQGMISDVAYTGVLSADRSVSAYVASVSNVVFVSNSRTQLENLIRVAKSGAPSLASRDEYVFFRNRYQRGDQTETAFAVLSDAAIRRWCGPRWRIEDARRTRAAAVMAELQAENVPALMSGQPKNSVLSPRFKLPDAGEWSLTPAGVVSSTYGSLQFMTPISEVTLTRVTSAEAESYKRWRDGYQNNWRQFYDPIAIRFSIARDRLGAEMTIMPLIASSEYNSIMAVSAGGKIAPDAGDPHADTLLHLMLAINTESTEIKDAGNFLGNFAPGLKSNPFAWVGHSLGIYLDEDPFWDRLAQATNTDDYLEKNYPDLPVALRVDVGSPLGLAAFLTSVHAFVDQSAPNLTKWENLDYNGQTYVKITAKAQGNSEERQPVIYYAATPGSLLVTLNEPLLKRAIDRQAAARNGMSSQSAKLDPPDPWLGTNISVSAKRKFVDVVQSLTEETYETHLQQLAWSNLPILNEWKRLYPDKDPVKVHEQLWGTKLVCPGGGAYVWNEKWQTMESTVFGHPGEPKKASGKALAQVLSAQLGVNFENQGISAKAVLNRKAEQP